MIATWIKNKSMVQKQNQIKNTKYTITLLLPFNPPLLCLTKTTLNLSFVISQARHRLFTNPLFQFEIENCSIEIEDWG
jgi:hypothetical protein